MSFLYISLFNAVFNNLKLQLASTFKNLPANNLKVPQKKKIFIKLLKWYDIFIEYLSAIIKRNENIFGYNRTKCRLTIAMVYAYYI